MATDKFTKGSEVKQLLDKNLRKYLLVNIASKRCRQLIGGEPRLVQREGMSTPLDVVMAEIGEEKLAVRDLPEGSPKVA